MQTIRLIPYSSDKHLQLFEEDAANFIPKIEEDEAKVFIDEERRVLVGYDIEKRPEHTIAQVELYVHPKHRGRWASRTFWKDFYGIPSHMGVDILVARVDNPIVVKILKAHQWREYCPGWWCFNLPNTFYNSEDTNGRPI